MEQFANRAQTNLNGAIDAAVTSLTVVSATAFPAAAPFRILIGTEILKVTVRAGNVFTVVRGSEGTTAAVHANNAAVTAIITKAVMDDLTTNLALAGAGKAVKAMADADQTLSVDEAANAEIQTTGALTAPRTLKFPDPSAATTSKTRTIHNACTVHRIIVGTVTGARVVRILPGCSAIVEINDLGAKEITRKVYDPRDFGCPWDGVRDDLPGLNAMMAVIEAAKDSAGLHDYSPARIKLPLGRGYCSDSWHIAHPVQIEGEGWGIDDSLSNLENHLRFPCLKPGIILDNYYTNVAYPAGVSSEGSTIHKVSLVSVQAVVTNGAVGGVGRAIRSLDTSLDLRVATTFYELGEVVLADAQSVSYGAEPQCEGATRTGPLVMFRVTTAGTTSSGGTPAAFATAGITELGDTIADGTVTWTVESVPKDYLNNTPYAVGERVFLPGDPGICFECIEAGTSKVFAAASFASGGIPVDVPTRMISTYYRGQFRDDGAAYPGGAGLKWITIMATGVMSLSGYSTIRECSIAGFTGHGGHATDQIDPTIYLGFGAQGNFTFFELCNVTHCGSGLKFYGGNTNGCGVTRLNVHYIGFGRTIVDGAAYFNTSPKWGTGACMAWDGGSGNSCFILLYGQGYTGLPVRNDRADQAGSSSNWISCVAEVSEKAHFVGRPVVLNCTGIPTTGQGVIIGLGNSRGIQELDNTGAAELTAILTQTGSGIYAFNAYAADSGNYWGWKYASNYWGMGYTNVPNAFSLSGRASGVDPGKGWLLFPRGNLVGAIASSRFRGPLAQFTDRAMRGGTRKVGDIFEDDTTKTVVTSDGYKGLPWTANTAIPDIEQAAESIPAYLVEPTANTGRKEGGEQVWKLTTAGTTHATTEPVWPSAPTPGVTTQSDGTCVWTFLGSTPSSVVTPTVAGALSYLARYAAYADVADLAAFTVLQDGVTGVAGDIVFLANQTTAAQCGLYRIGVVAVGVAPLRRISDLPTGATYRNGCTVEVSEGTIWAGSTWKSMATGAKVVGTDDPLFYPRVCKGTATLAGNPSVKALGATEGLFLFSTTKSDVKTSLNTIGGVLGTYGFSAPIADRTAGKSGTGALTIRSLDAAGTAAVADTSTVDYLVTNW